MSATTDPSTSSPGADPDFDEWLDALDPDADLFVHDNDLRMPPPPIGWSIFSAAGEDPVKAMELADRIGFAVEQAETASAILGKAVDARVAALKHRKEALQARAKERVDRLKAALLEYASNAPRSGKARVLPLPSGREVTWAFTKGKTALNEDATFALARTNDELYDRWVRMEEDLDTGAVRGDLVFFNGLIVLKSPAANLDAKTLREGCELKDGHLVLRKTGEIVGELLDPVKYTDATGQEMTAPLIAVIEQPHEEVKVKPAKTGEPGGVDDGDREAE
jgi:hypothetical protein